VDVVYRAPPDVPFAVVAEELSVWRDQFLFERRRNDPLRQWKLSEVDLQAQALWDEFTEDIDAGNPVELLVDTNGNGSTDHFVTAVGYDDTPGSWKYAAHVTWDLELHWFSFKALSKEQRWGVYGATFYDPVPEPAAAAVLCAGMMLLLRRRTQRRHRGRKQAKDPSRCDHCQGLAAKAARP